MLLAWLEWHCSMWCGTKLKKPFTMNNLEVVQQKVEINGCSPSKSINIVQLSDLHFGKMEKIHEEIIGEINRLRPNLVFITGDIITSGKKLPLIYEFVSQIKSLNGVFSVLGNWEYWSHVGISNVKQMYEKAECMLLINQKKDVLIDGIKLSIIGVDDYIGGKPDLKCNEKHSEAASYKILLSHCPGYRNRIISEDIDLVLSGHTHGGQINIFGRSLVVPRGSDGYIAGWYGVQKPKLYVNRGIGTSLLPLRIGARPEMTVFSS